MKRVCAFALLLAACGHRDTRSATGPAGAAIVLVSGESQFGGIGERLDQPLVFQVNDAQGSPVAGALVSFTGAGLSFDPESGVTGPEGQIATGVRLGSVHGGYEVVASNATHQVRAQQTALGYEETLGREVSRIHCDRCHDAESTAERVSNHDNLRAAAHAFTDRAAMKAMSDATLRGIIGKGGPAVRRSAEMPPYAGTLTRAELAALTAWIRAASN